MYQVLARKYRPRNFSQLVGQNHVAKALSSALQRGRLHHAYLFTGTRGVGKTTIARILAKCLNCETGVTATPCETCAICTAVNEGRFIDLIEIDAASRTGVDDTRELLNNVPYAPTQGRYKVYLIDEVHMFSNSSFNALLKTLEEPPEHVKFLFATTDPQKLPITVISRCLQFTLRPLAKDEIFQHLDHVLMAENIPHEAEALWQLSESAQGSLRDALSLTDQAIAYGEGQVLAHDVQDMLGLINKNLVLDLLLNIHQNQRLQVAQLLIDMRQQAIDVTHVLEQLISVLHDMALLQCLNINPQDQEVFEQRKNQIAQLINAQDLQLYYQIALQGRADLALSLTPEQGFEMCVMRLLAFRPLSHTEIVTIEANTIDSTASMQLQTPTTLQPAHTALSISTDETAPISSQEEYIHSDHNQAEQIHSTDHAIHNDSADDLVAESSENNLETSIQENQLFNDAQLTSDTVYFSDHQHIKTIEKSPEEMQIPTESMDEIPLSEKILKIDPPLPIEPQHSTAKEQPITALTLPLQDQNEITEVLHNEAPENNNDQVKNTLQTQIIADPRELLNPEMQDLSGEWTLLKWDYWLRQNHLSPAVKEIAQHGIMQGQIDGKSTLTLDQSYQRLFEKFINDVEHALKQLHSQLVFDVQYKNIAQDSPFELQQQRKRLAYETAQQKISTHPVISEILEELGATIEDFNLKP